MSDIVDRMTRPIIGIEYRTAQEAFDIMADRFREAATAIEARDAEIARLRATLSEQRFALDLALRGTNDLVQRLREAEGMVAALASAPAKTVEEE